MRSPPRRRASTSACYLIAMPVDSRIWFRAWCAWLKCEPLPLLADLDLDRLPVSDCQRALTWYERLLGSGPAFLPHATEAGWELAGHRYLYIVE